MHLYFFLVFLGFICPCFSVHKAADHAVDKPEVRFLMPPQITLSSRHFGQKFAGFRPCRKGGPRLEIEERAKQTIVHNYGHGGSGWTMGPGCAQKMVKDLLVHAQHRLSADYDEKVFKAQPVSVLGAGVIGSFTAYELWANGFTNIRIIAEETKGLASDVSGGLIAPISMWHDGPDLESVLLDTYRTYDCMRQGTHPHFREGVQCLSAYFRTEEQSGYGPYIAAGLMKPSKKVILRFPHKRQAMIAYDDALFADAEVLMQRLHQFLIDKGIPFENRRVTALADLKTPIVVNAAGLGVISLTDVADEGMTSVQGHLMMLRDQPRAALEYMIFDELKEIKTSSGLPYRQFFCWLPKSVSGPGDHSHGVIGGSFIPNASCTDDHFTEVLPRIFDQARDFFGLV